MAPSWMRMANDLPNELIAPAEETLHQQQVPGRGDGEEFGQALDDAEDRRLDEINIRREGMHGGAPGIAWKGRALLAQGGGSWQRKKP